MAILSSFDLIQEFKPHGGSTEVPVGTVLTVRFAQHMEANSINASTFWLSDPQDQRVQAEVTYDAAKRMATLTPAEPLAGLTRYRAHVMGGPNGVRSALGYTLGVDFTWNFETDQANYLPPPVLIAPADQSKTAAATPEFSWQIIEDAVGYDFQIARSPDFHVMYFETHIPQGDDERIDFTPSVPLQSALDIASIYFWRVRGVSADGTPGVWSPPWQFNNATYTEPGDGWQPVLEVTSVSPEPRSIDVPLGAPIVIGFSEDIDPNSIQVDVYVRRL